MKNGASMIELVIAIVVMGIAVMTLPLMLTTTQNNNAFALQQETILAARTQLGDMLTYPWDEHTVGVNHAIGVLDTDSASYKRFPDNNSTRRIGHIKGNRRRKFFTSLTYATPTALLGKDGNETIDDIDDFSTATPTTIHLVQNAGVLDYRFDFNMTTTVRYINDTASPSNFTFLDTNITNTSNIKMITIKLQGKDINTLTFRAYSCNIGANELLRRDF